MICYLLSCQNYCNQATIDSVLEVCITYLLQMICCLYSCQNYCNQVTIDSVLEVDITIYLSADDLLPV